MRATLVRVGVDQSYGGWNAPIDPESGEFVYVPIPEGAGTPPRRALATSYDAFEPALRAFAAVHGGEATEGATLPPHLRGLATHLDPDFAALTYGDDGERRGRRLAAFRPGDVVAFYAGLRPIRPCAHRLLYALVGLYRVAEVVRAGDVPRERWAENAHLRRLRPRATDVVVRAAPGGSGRLRRALPIGEYRGGAYRVRPDLLAEWGGLSCRDGYLQRSAVPPLLVHPERFLAWFEAQAPQLVAANV